MKINGLSFDIADFVRGGSFKVIAAGDFFAVRV